MQAPPERRCQRVKADTEKNAIIPANSAVAMQLRHSLAGDLTVPVKYLVPCSTAAWSR